MDFVVICVLPIVAVLAILWICKRYNFSILPKELRGKTPEPVDDQDSEEEDSEEEYRWTKVENKKNKRKEKRDNYRDNYGENMYD